MNRTYAHKIDSLKQLIDQYTAYRTDTDVWIDQGSASSASTRSDNFSVNYRIIIDVNDRTVPWYRFLAIVRNWYLANAKNLTDDEIREGFNFDVAVTNLDEDYLQIRLDMKDVIIVTKDENGDVIDANASC